jgi:hypothetical protein
MQHLLYSVRKFAQVYLRTGHNQDALVRLVKPKFCVGGATISEMSVLTVHMHLRVGWFARIRHRISQSLYHESSGRTSSK